MSCVSPLRGFKDKTTGGITFKRSNNAGEDMRVPCGQCIECRWKRSKDWAARIIHEASQYDENCFITLTYRDRSQCTQKQLDRGLHLPDSGSLVKSHYQKFMKRLRQHFKDRKIKYYQCGEYGDNNNRPHHHACIFNLRFPDEQFLGQHNGNALFTSETLERLWGYGFTSIGELTYDSAAYVARYVLKKVTGARADDHYLRCDEYGVAYWLEPEYTTMSLGRKKGEGIGGTWAKQYLDDLYPSDELPIPGVGVVRGVPRYYETICEAEDPVTLAKVKEARRLFAKEHKHDYTMQRLEDRYKCRMASIARKRREL